MTITERIFVILSQKKITQKDFSKQINVNEKTVSAWKKNNSLPPLDKISDISDYLGVSIDYLLTGKEHHNDTNISNSAVGAVGDHSNGTVTINNQTSNTNGNNTQIIESNVELNETASEILRILKDLPLKERSKLLTMIYDFEDDYKNSL